jgi:hypothetical protein
LSILALICGGKIKTEIEETELRIEYMQENKKSTKDMHLKM